tara:strand:+ start:3220 stop:3555 length:336 start_codon:yes stop_codon:yes gene_type:complete
MFNANKLQEDLEFLDNFLYENTEYGTDIILALENLAHHLTMTSFSSEEKPEIVLSYLSKHFLQAINECEVPSTHIVDILEEIKDAIDNKLDDLIFDMHDKTFEEVKYERDM